MENTLKKLALFLGVKEEESIATVKVNGVDHLGIKLNISRIVDLLSKGVADFLQDSERCQFYRDASALVSEEKGLPSNGLKPGR